MMDKADRLRDRILGLMKKAWQTAVMTAVASIALGVTCGCAHDDEAPLVGAGVGHSPYEDVKYIKYDYFQSTIYDPVYEVAWKAMAPLYKDTEYAWGVENSLKPAMDIGQVDLNGDRLPEIVATPVEDDDEAQTATFCNEAGNCPFYVFEARDKDVHILLKTNAYAIDLDDTVQNGHWNLKVFYNSDTPPYAAKIATYTYDRKKDAYVAVSPPPQPPNQRRRSLRSCAWSEGKK